MPKLGKNINLNSKLGEINDIDHNKGSTIYPQNQIILDCIMPSIPLKHMCSSIILIWIIVSRKWSLKKIKKKNLFFFCVFFCLFYFSYFGKTDMVLGKKVAIFIWEWGRNSAPREGLRIPWDSTLLFVSPSSVLSSFYIFRNTVALLHTSLILS